MIIGVPREVKDHEHRVGLTPTGAAALASSGHRVLVEKRAGWGSGFSDEDYTSAGASIVKSAREVWEAAELLVKVKEPITEEFQFLRPGLILFAYLHLAANLDLAERLAESGTTAIAYEMVENREGNLPLLAPMSEIAGRLAPQVAAQSLERESGGRGILIGGATGVRPACVTILGAGTVGSNAARVAMGMGGDVTVIDRDPSRLRAVGDAWAIKTLCASSTMDVAQLVVESDVVVGAALVAGARAPVLVTEEHVLAMKPGSVIVDVAIDQGGCFATSTPTTHSSKTYIKHGVVHYCVTNMPALVPRTATLALTNRTLDYIVNLANQGVASALDSDSGFAKGVNVQGNRIVARSILDSV